MNYNKEAKSLTVRRVSEVSRTNKADTRSSCSQLQQLKEDGCYDSRDYLYPASPAPPPLQHQQQGTDLRDETQSNGQERSNHS